MKRLTLVSMAALIGLCTAASPTSAQTPAKKPNILVLFGDDIGYCRTSAPTTAG